MPGDGMAAPEELAVMQREIPGWVEEMNGRRVRLLGRELDLPETAATVRVRDGEMLVTDGPFTQTEEFIAGIDVVSCTDRQQATGSRPLAVMALATAWSPAFPFGTIANPAAGLGAATVRDAIADMIARIVAKNGTGAPAAGPKA
jgi:hypothetical protein